MKWREALHTPIPDEPLYLAAVLGTVLAIEWPEVFAVPLLIAAFVVFVVLVIRILGDLG